MTESGQVILPPSALSVDELLRRAHDLQLRGASQPAQALYRQALQSEPNCAPALHMLGVMATQNGDPQRGAELIANAIRLDPSHAVAYCNFANALLALGRFSEALKSLDLALALRPDYPLALLNRGIAQIHLGEFAAAIESLSKALSSKAHAAAVLLNRGIALARLGRTHEAIADYERAERLAPGYLEPILNRGTILAALDRHVDALAAYDAVLALDSNCIDALSGRGLALLSLDRYEEAVETLDRLVTLAPSASDAHNNRGLALRHLKRFDEALLAFDKAIALRARFPAALSNRGWIALQLSRPQEAIFWLEQALAEKPDLTEALTNLGAAYRQSGRLDVALTYCEQALALDPDSRDALSNCGTVLMETGRLVDAAACFERLLSIAPDSDFALGNLFEARLRCCDWRDYAAFVDRIVQSAIAGRPVVRPFFLLAVTDDPVAQLACARAYAEQYHHLGEDETGFQPLGCAKSGRIRLAYVSGDFSEHAVAYLTAGLFEHHDRQRFEVFAISLRATEPSPMNLRLRAAFDHFVDMAGADDVSVVSAMRSLEVDIAVDLSGYTGVGRTGIFRKRAAPIQVNYLGFPGTMGVSCMDYIIADDFLIPETQSLHYAEQIAYLPRCFQANDDRRAVAAESFTREQVGLPQQGFVFCCFNNGYKIGPAIFDIWLRVLNAVPGSILWLIAESPQTQMNLRQHATALGVSDQRLIFGSRAAYPVHLARMGLADLFLDCLPFNGGTTASDALWAGLPVLTCAGRSFAARMAGSLLRTIGLAELIAHDLEQYEALAVRLGNDPPQLAALRTRLGTARLTSPLFDTPRFCRDLESAYTIMWERCQRGEPPATFRVRDRTKLAPDRGDS